ncbi:MAG: hypothetical protein EBT93_17865 [Alphaproteobacteria bacterium]|nr:hypothetical protein [Alphaproteobacteria bacterium]
MRRCDDHGGHPEIQLNDAGCAFFDRSDLHEAASMSKSATRQKVKFQDLFSQPHPLALNGLTISKYIR